MLHINEETSKELVTMFASLENFEQKFPSLSKCIVDHDALQQEQYVSMQYDEEKEVLNIFGYLEIALTRSFTVAYLEITNDSGKTWNKKYNILGEKYYVFDDEMSIKSVDAKNLTGSITYLYALPQQKTHQENSTTSNEVLFSLGKTMVTLDTSESYITDVRVEHPHKFEKFEYSMIIYGNPARNPYSYRYDDTNVRIPIAIKFKMNQKFDNLKVKCKFLNFNDEYCFKGGEIKIFNKTSWDAFDKQSLYPIPNFVEGDEYVLMTPLDWNISCLNFCGQFFLKSSFEIFSNGKPLQKLLIRSSTHQKPYYNSTVEIPFFNVRKDCVEQSSLVKLIKDGTVYYKAISEVMIGEYVVAKNSTDAYLVSGNYIGENEDMILLQVKDVTQPLLLTSTHPILTEEGWKIAKEVTESDRIFMEDGTYYPVSNLTPCHEMKKTNMLCVEGEHGFFANGYYVGDMVQDGHKNIQDLKALPLSPQLREDLRNLSEGDW